MESAANDAASSFLAFSSSSSLEDAGRRLEVTAGNNHVVCHSSGLMLVKLLACQCPVGAVDYLGALLIFVVCLAVLTWSRRQADPRGYPAPFQALRGSAGGYEGLSNDDAKQRSEAWWTEFWKEVRGLFCSCPGCFAIILSVLGFMFRSTCFYWLDTVIGIGVPLVVMYALTYIVIYCSLPEEQETELQQQNDNLGELNRYSSAPAVMQISR
eukprot:TRINITY_DN23576_c0_g2_i1.p1 TRINITY_DN23576_c0_g2~~TRINITY_DN23576_c0_g2_i1.p1  ORF type:complete len:233 (+),score=41.42 TRINITY_DN23576_c0_g2_i1:66-701(+)